MTNAARDRLAALLWAAWGGGALVTIAVVAPAAFAVLPTRTLAGALVGAVLPWIFVSGIVVALVVVLLAERRVVGASVTALLSLAANAVAQFGIGPRIARIRQEIGGAVDALPVDDARRVAFGLLHGYSVGALGVAMLAGACSLGFLLFMMRERR